MNRPALLIAALMVGFPFAAWASPAVEIQFFDDLARRAYAERDYARALEAFLLANDVTPSPRSLYNVGVCAELAGDDALAHAAYEEYLGSSDDDASRRTDAESRMVALRARLALVSVTSEPPGALIFVDRRELGAFGNTPRTIVVAPGQHRIELLLPDHEASTQAIDAVVGRTVATAARLKVKTGSLVVRAAPRDAVIRAVRDGAAPLTLHSGRGASLPVGSYRVTAAAPGHAAGETVAVIRADAPTTLDLVLRPLPVPTGRLLVDTGTVPARVFIDGKPAAVTPATLPSVAAGRHRITLEARGYRPWSGTVEVRHGEATFVNATLTERGR